jgi:hypothetical protein
MVAVGLDWGPKHTLMGPRLRPPDRDGGPQTRHGGLVKSC